MSAEEALEGLRSLALRSESADSVDELVREVVANGLRHPGPPIVLVVTVDSEGQSQVQYTTDPTYAADALRRIAEGIDRDTLI